MPVDGNRSLMTGEMWEYTSDLPLGNYRRNTESNALVALFVKAVII